MPKKTLRNPDKAHIFLSDDQRARLVAEAAETPKFLLPELLKRFGVCDKTYRRILERTLDDAPFAALVAEKEKAQRELWEQGLRETARPLMAAIQHHARLALAAERFDPDMVHKLAGALKIVNDAAVTRGMVLLGQPAPNARANQTAAKNAGLGDRAPSGAVPPGRDGAGASGSATPAAPTGQPQH